MAYFLPDLKLLLILNPRTASTSTASHLGKHFGGKWVPNENMLDDNGMIVIQKKHSTIPQLLEHGLFERSEIETMVRLVCVRNPFDSLASFWVKKRNIYAKASKNEDFFGHKIAGFQQHDEFIQNNSFSDWVEQIFLKNKRPTDKNSVNRNHMHLCTDILRFENLKADFADFCSRMGLDIPDIPNINPTEGKEPYQTYYTDRARELVEEYFWWDVEKLGYSFE